eukprot:2001540-Pyramimonas_sp.AAC.1
MTRNAPTWRPVARMQSPRDAQVARTQPPREAQATSSRHPSAVSRAQVASEQEDETDGGRRGQAVKEHTTSAGGYGIEGCVYYGTRIYYERYTRLAPPPFKERRRPETACHLGS